MVSGKRGCQTGAQNEGKAVSLAGNLGSQIRFDRVNKEEYSRTEERTFK
jgi:hypothetical protein